MKITLHSQFSIIKFQTGFTLIEVLIVATLVGVMGLVTTELLSRTFKASNKVQIIGKVKENGQSAINQIDETLRFAQEVSCVSSDNHIMVVKTRDGSYKAFRYYAPVKNIPGKQDQNGVITSQTLSPSASPQTVCNENLIDYPFLRGQPLTDYSDKVKGVSVNSVVFTKTTSPIAKDVANITIDVGPAVNSPLRSDQQISDIKFQTSIVLR